MWARFRTRLTVEGRDQAAIMRMRTPIGMPEPSCEEHAAIALSVAT